MFASTTTARRHAPVTAATLITRESKTHQRNQTDDCVLAECENTMAFLSRLRGGANQDSGHFHEEEEAESNHEEEGQEVLALTETKVSASDEIKEEAKEAERDTPPSKSARKPTLLDFFKDDHSGHLAQVNVWM